MKLGAIFRFELAYQVRRVWPWLICAVLLVFAFLMTRDGTLAEALLDDFFVNSPFAVAKTTVAGGLIWLLVAAAVAGEAAARDVATGMHPLVYTAPIGKLDYLGGRFLAALVLNASLLLAVQAGILLGVHWPGVDPALIGPFRPAAYLTAYGFLALPNVFVATALQFALAARSGRAMASYVGSLLLFFTGFFVAGLLLFRRSLGKLLDPIGIRFVLDDLSHAWTTHEKSWRLIELEGTVLANRLLWLGVGVSVLAVTYLRFRFAQRVESSRWRRKPGRAAHAPIPAGIGLMASAPITVPRVPRTFGFALHARQTLALAGASFRTIATSWGGRAFLVGIPLLTIPVVIDQMVAGGVPLTPTTVQVLGELTAPLSAELSRWVIVPLFLVFFAGELCWREREAGLGEITDALPGSEWAPLLGKLLGLGLVLVVFLALLIAAGVLAQTLLGQRDLELGLYATILFGLQLPEYLLFALLAVVVHVLFDQKYVGHLAAIVAYVFIALASLFGVEHDLLVYGAGPAWSYTEMRGFGPTLGPWLSFELYWAAWALLLAVVARLFWLRGRERGLWERLRSARSRLARPTLWTAAAATGLVLGLGGFVFYNTNVLNEYLSAYDLAERSAEYERRYGGYDGIPQPRLAAARLQVEIHPERRAVDVRGTYRLLNESAVAIDSVHVATSSSVETGEMQFDRPATRVLADEELGHRIYALETPLRPGDALELDFHVLFEPHGFGESGVDAPVVANGTYFTNAGFPALGYQRSRELMTAGDRREHGLAPRPLIPSLDDVEARKDRDGGILLDAVVVTSADQVAVAPGELRRTWTEGDRRSFHYSTDGPIGGTWAFLSADYALHDARWTDPDGSGREVAIRIFHHPRHTALLDCMVRSIQASLTCYGREFGPYEYGHVTFAEHPGNGVGLHAEPGLLTFSEGFALQRPQDDPDSLDLPFAVVAHEMAHQWTVPYALVEGAPVMSESLAWYSAMQVVRENRGAPELRRLLSFMRQPYPIEPIRRGEPLLRGLDPYMSYRRGPFALHALSEYIGVERVNAALRRLLERHRPPEAPLATTLDLVRELRAVTPDAFQYLLHDLFEVNTFWELETQGATAEPIGADGWQVTLDVRARKVVVDETGAETEMPMDELVEVGVFAPVEVGGELDDPLYVQEHEIRSGEQTIRVTVPRRPDLAGIDPYHRLDVVEQEDDDNIEAVSIRIESGGA